MIFLKNFLKPFLCLAFFLGFNCFAQEVIILGNESICSLGRNQVNVLVNGTFATDNQYFLEIYDPNDIGTLLDSYPYTIVDGKAFFNISASYDFDIVRLKTRSTNPVGVFDHGIFKIYGTPRINLVNKASIENKYYNKHERVELRFSLATTSASQTTLTFASGEVSRPPNSRNFIKDLFIPETGTYGVVKIENQCGANSLPKTAQLNVRSQRVRLQIADKFGKVCPGERFEILIQSDDPLNNGHLVNCNVTDANGNPVSISYEKINNSIHIDTPTDLTGGTYTVNISIPSLNFDDSRNFVVENTSLHILSGNYDVKYGEGVLVNYDVDTTGNPTYDNYYTTLLLNDKKMVFPYNENKIALRNLKESGEYFITSASSKCFQRFAGSANINVRTTVIIDSISKTEICNGEEILFFVHSNGNLPFSNDYQLRVGTTNYKGAVSNEFFSSEYNPIPLTWVNDSTFKLTPANYALLNKSNSYHVAIRNSSLNILGRVSQEKIIIRDTPNPTFNSTTYLSESGNEKVYFSETFYPDGVVQMNDGKTYEMYHHRNNTGYINVNATQPKSNFAPVIATNKCGSNSSISGSVNISPINTENIYFELTNPSNKCQGDELSFVWEAAGGYNSSNIFSIQFLIDGVTVTSVPIAVGQTSVTIPPLSNNQYYYKVAIVASAPNTQSQVLNQTVFPSSFNPSVTLNREALGKYSIELESGVEVSSNTEVYFILGDSHLAKYYTSNGEALESYQRFTLSQDTTITISYATSGCDTVWLNQSYEFFVKPYFIYPKELIVSCDGDHSLLKYEYWTEGNTSPSNSLELWVAPFLNFTGTETGNYIKAETLFSENNSIIASIGYPQITPGGYAVKLIDPINDVESTPLGSNLDFEYDTKITSNLGNDLILDSIPAKITVTIEGSSGYYGTLNEPLFPLDFEMDITQDTLLFAYFLESQCGFVTPRDSIEVNVIPHPTYITSTDVPCLGSNDSLKIYYDRTIEKLEDNANLQFYLWDGVTKIPLTNGRHRNRGYITPIPQDIPSGQYFIGFSRENPVIDRLFTTYNEFVVLDTRPFARVLPGTIYRYSDDTNYSIPIYTEGGNGNYGIITNVSELMETFEDPFFPTFGYFPIAVNSSGYNMLNQSTLFATPHDSLKITEIRTSFEGCLGAFEGGVNLEYIDGSQHKIFAKKPTEESQIRLVCEGGEDIEVLLDFEGSFNSGNVFIPQLSDKDGINFTDLIFSRSGNTFNVSLPSILPEGEGYKIRFRSTSPVHFGATSDFAIIIKEKPILNLSGSQTITDGETYNLPINITGISPFNISFSDGQSFENIPIPSFGIDLRPSETTTYNVSQVSDKYCENTGTGDFILKVLCKPFQDVTGTFNGNLSYKALKLESSGLFETNSKTGFKAGDSIVLKPGFNAEAGSVFSTELQACEE